jgi:hypothetical protein
MNPFYNAITIRDDIELYTQRFPQTFQNSGRYEQHTMKEGETLQSIAYRYYGDSGYWGYIADANGILDPFDIQMPPQDKPKPHTSMRIIDLVYPGDGRSYQFLYIREPSYNLDFYWMMEDFQSTRFADGTPMAHTPAPTIGVTRDYDLPTDADYCIHSVSGTPVYRNTIWSNPHLCAPGWSFVQGTEGTQLVNWLNLNPQVWPWLQRPDPWAGVIRVDLATRIYNRISEQIEVHVSSDVYVNTSTNALQTNNVMFNHDSNRNPTWSYGVDQQPLLNWYLNIRFRVDPDYVHLYTSGAGKSKDYELYAGRILLIPQS